MPPAPRASPHHAAHLPRTLPPLGQGQQTPFSGSLAIPGKLQQEIKHRLEHIVGRATAFRYLRATAFRYLRQEKQLFFCGQGLQNRVDLVQLIPQTRSLEKERDIRGRA